MTDKVHPVVEAMARAICLADHVDPDSCDNNVADTVFLPNWTAYIENAKAAAKVLLEMLPTEAMLIAGSEGNPTVWNDETDAGFGLSVANDVYVAMTAAARSEMGLEG